MCDAILVVHLDRLHFFKLKSDGEGAGELPSWSEDWTVMANDLLEISISLGESLHGLGERPLLREWIETRFDLKICNQLNYPPV